MVSQVCAYHGGDEEIRTLDPLLAGQVLSQLSYTPVAFAFRVFLLRTLKIEQRPTSSKRFTRTLRLFFFMHPYCEMDAVSFLLLECHD